MAKKAPKTEPAETIVETVDPDTGEILNDAALEAAEQVFRWSPDKLIGQVADFLLGELRDAKERKPWAQMPQHEQDWLISRAEGQARSIVAGVVRSIASKGFSRVDAIVEGGTFKEGELQIKLRAVFNTENVEALATKGKFVQLVFADADEFEGEASAKSQPNQPPLPISEDEDEDDEEDAPVFDATDAGREHANGAAP